MNFTTPINFFAMTDLAVLGTNPECADYTNPRGEIVGHAAYVCAEDAAGNRKRFFIKADLLEARAIEPAEKFAAALQARLAAGKLPVGFASWVAARPAYGSEAYEAYGAEDDLAWEAEQD